MPKNNDLIKLLQELRELRLTTRFCENEDWSYKGTYDNKYLSSIIIGKRNGSKYFNRAIIEDINNFLTHIKMNENVKVYLDNAPLDEAIKMVDDEVVSYAEVLEYQTTPLS